MKILITGGMGYIGRYLVDYFSRLEYEVIITSRKSINNSKINIRHMDLNDLESVRGICKDIDIVIHTANIDERTIKSQSKNALLINSYGTKELYLDAIKNDVQQFIYLSTFHVYGKDFGYIDENTLLEPRNDYGLTHFFAEEYIKQLARINDVQMKSDIIRLTNGIGEPINCDKWYLALNDFCKSAFLHGKIQLNSSGLAIRDFIAIKDIVYAIKILIEKTDLANSNVSIYNISSQNSCSIRELAEKTKEIYESRYKKKCELIMPQVSFAEKKQIRNLYVSSEKLRSLGWNNKYTLEMIINDIFNYIEKCNSFEN